MNIQRGDVVLVNYPFASGVGSKTRPASVVQCDTNNARLDNTIVAPITSRTRFARKEPTQLLIEVTSAAGQQSGLINDSAVSCENIYTVRQDTIVRKLGSLPADVMEQIEGCIKASLELP